MCMQKTPINTIAITKELQRSPAFRPDLARKSHLWYFLTYFSEYAEYQFAEFHKEIFELTEDENISVLAIAAFRGASKSTICSLSFPLWSIMGKPQKKFVIMFTKTMTQAKQVMRNLREQLEGNSLLRSDLGPFEEDSGEWGLYSVVLPKYGARITIASTEQSVRGLRHGPYRPDLIVLDDVEDYESTRTEEMREKLRNWFESEVLPLGDPKKTRFVMIGNKLHDNSLLMHVKSKIESNEISGIYREYPLVNEDGSMAWPEKFDEQAVDKLKTSGELSTFMREYMLKIVSDDFTTIRPEWIRRYTEPLFVRSDTYPQPNAITIAVDPAVSPKQTADYSAIVVIYAYRYGYKKDKEERLRLVVGPSPVNERLSMKELVDRIKEIYTYNSMHVRPKIYIEENGFQRWLIEKLNDDGYPAYPIKSDKNKYSRLASVSYLIEDGTVLFPDMRLLRSTQEAKAMERLLNQLTGVGFEKHDDLMDAFTYGITASMQNETHRVTSGNTRPDILSW